GPALGNSYTGQANAASFEPSSGLFCFGGFVGQAISIVPASQTFQSQFYGAQDGLVGCAPHLTPGPAPLQCGGPTSLCLNNRRFPVQFQWTTPQGQTGPGQAVAVTGDTVYFWFFSDNNVEMVVKVVDGRAFNARFWVFAGGLTNVDVLMSVTDTKTGIV